MILSLPWNRNHKRQMLCAVSFSGKEKKCECFCACRTCWWKSILFFLRCSPGNLSNSEESLSIQLLQFLFLGAPSADLLPPSVVRGSLRCCVLLETGTPSSFQRRWWVWRDVLDAWLPSHVTGSPPERVKRCSSSSLSYICCLEMTLLFSFDRRKNNPNCKKINSFWKMFFRHVCFVRLAFLKSLFVTSSDSTTRRWKVLRRCSKTSCGLPRPTLLPLKTFLNSKKLSRFLFSCE